MSLVRIYTYQFKIILVSSSYKRLLSTNGWVKYDITAGNGLHVGAKIFK